MPDLFQEALNSPSGLLAEFLIRNVTNGDTSELPDNLRARLDQLIDAGGKPGLLARVRLARDVAYLFDRAPEWTTSRLVPHFRWDSPDAAELWSARKYSRSIGSPRLFSLMKRPFLEIFGRSNVSIDDLGIFAGWLTTILIANRTDNANYPLLTTEARLALRRGGAELLPSVAHRLAIELQKAPIEQKNDVWRAAVNPVFQAIWPLDIDLQTRESTFKLVQLLCSSGSAFSKVFDAVIYFIRPSGPDDYSTIFSLWQAPREIYEASPEKILDLVYAILGEAAPGKRFYLDKVLERVRELDPTLVNTTKFQRLQTHTLAF